MSHFVHGGIRHLERLQIIRLLKAQCSWRHTPFRNDIKQGCSNGAGSWRHTPFRKRNIIAVDPEKRSWRHTPFRNNKPIGG